MFKIMKGLGELMFCLDVRGNYKIEVKDGVIKVELFNENKGVIVKAESKDPVELLRYILK